MEPFLYPVTLPSFFLPLTVELGASDDPVSTTDASLPTTPGTPPAYDVAVARLNDLVVDCTLTADQQMLLHSAMIIAQSLVAQAGIHSLVNIIASPSTLASEVLELSPVITAGMRAFIAFPGPGTGTSTASGGSLIEFIKTFYGNLDNCTCLVTGRLAGSCCDIIPYSVQGYKAENFWEFVAMFKGHAATHRLKLMTVGPHPSSTDSIRNVLWLSPETHQYLDNGQMAIVPVMTSDAAYDPGTVTEVCCPNS